MARVLLVVRAVANLEARAVNVEGRMVVVGRDEEAVGEEVLVVVSVLLLLAVVAAGGGVVVVFAVGFF